MESHSASSSTCRIFSQWVFFSPCESSCHVWSLVCGNSTPEFKIKRRIQHQRASKLIRLPTGTLSIFFDLLFFEKNMHCLNFRGFARTKIEAMVLKNCTRLKSEKMSPVGLFWVHRQKKSSNYQNCDALGTGFTVQTCFPISSGVMHGWCNSERVKGLYFLEQNLYTFTCCEKRVFIAFWRREILANPVKCSPPLVKTSNAHGVSLASLKRVSAMDLAKLTTSAIATLFEPRQKALLAKLHANTDVSNSWPNGGGHACSKEPASQFNTTMTNSSSNRILRSRRRESKVNNKLMSSEWSWTNQVIEWVIHTPVIEWFLHPKTNNPNFLTQHHQTSTLL